MRIFLAGATGVIGRRLALLLRDARHEVTGTTRDPSKTTRLQALGITPVVVDVFDADAVARAVAGARPQVVIHQLTDLPNAPGTPGYAAGQEANRRLRIEGTRNLVQAAALVGVGWVIAQSIAFAYAPGAGVRQEDDPLDVNADSPRQLTVQGILALECEVLQTRGIAGDRASLRLSLWVGNLVRRVTQATIGSCGCGRSCRVAGARQRVRRLQHRRE